MNDTEAGTEPPVERLTAKRLLAEALEQAGIYQETARILIDEVSSSAGDARARRMYEAMRKGTARASDSP